MGKSYVNVKSNEWVYPTKKGYYFACCDCGLVHEMDFQPILIVPAGKNAKGLELVHIVPIVNRDIRVRFRARRSDRRTGQVRRHRHIKIQEEGR